MDNTMLIVDDSEQDREILCLLFHNQFEILEAENGQEALDILQSCNGNIDVVLLDMMMPNLSGLEVLSQRRYLECFKHVPVVVITASNAEEDQIKAFELGANDYVTKPFVPEIVTSRVSNVIASNARLARVQEEFQKRKIQAETDGLTGLLNARTTEALAAEVLHRRPDGLHALLLLEIERNPERQDALAPHTLRIVADMIAGQFRKSDILGYVGDGIFVVMMTDIPSRMMVQNKIRDMVERMKYLPNISVPANVSLSVGYAFSGGESMDYTVLMQHARHALCQAKAQGRARAAEYGDTGAGEADTRQVMAVIGRNLAICAAVRKAFEPEYRMLELLDCGEAEKLSAEQVKNIVLVYADGSNLNPPEYAAFWQRLRQMDWIRDVSVIAVCQEGNLSQYREALLHAVADVLTVPTDAEKLRRRSVIQMKRNGCTPVS